MRKSTIKLTKHELDFASDTIYPETKHSVIQKTQQLFVDCGQKLSQNPLYQEYTQHNEFKITRGEQYQKLPYMVLDYPQIKGGNVDLVMRTMFWWGHYFSCNLIIKTTHLTTKQNTIAIQQLSKTRVLVGENLWEQDLYSTEFCKLSKLSFEDIKELISTRTYLKLSRKIALRNHTKLPNIIDKVYSEWLTTLSIKKGAV
ncbi:hypothetical protein AEM51_07850 [Bacteroidetes bacterium UKL13-3]|jgi:hypothetical protein|nr:hypothetical protein AEM51_07850 [Bacteroidetes bacterium UKL13-3]